MRVGFDLVVFMAFVAVGGVRDVGIMLLLLGGVVVVLGGFEGFYSIGEGFQEEGGGGVDGRIVDCGVGGGLGGCGKGQDVVDFFADGGEGVGDELEGFLDVEFSAGLGPLDDGVFGGCENFGEVDGDVAIVVVGVEGEGFVVEEVEFCVCGG